MKQIYLIERIWTCSIENTYEAAVGYEPYGYIEDYLEAIKFCEKSKEFTIADCWAISEPMKEFKLKPLNRIE